MNECTVRLNDKGYCNTHHTRPWFVPITGVQTNDPPPKQTVCMYVWGCAAGSKGSEQAWVRVDRTHRGADEGDVAVVERNLRHERCAAERLHKVDEGLRVVRGVVVRAGVGEVRHAVGGVVVAPPACSFPHARTRNYT